MFKPNQKVVVLKLYNLREDGAATVVSEIYVGRDKGKYILDVPHSGYIVVSPERIVDSKEYWKQKRRE